MVKGRQRRMIVVPSPDSQLFEEAIFILRDEALQEGAGSREDILRQARQTAEAYTKAHGGKRRWLRISPPIAAACGAAATGLAWLASQLISLPV